MYYLEIILLSAFMYYQAKMDSNHIRSGSYIYEHKTRVVQRGLFILALSIPNLFDDVLYTLTMIMTLIGVWASAFSPMVGIMLGKSTFYLGSTAKWDMFMKRLWGWYSVFIVVNLIFWLSVYFMYLY